MLILRIMCCRVIAILLVCSGIAFADYSRNLPNGYRYIETYSDYEGRIIVNPEHGIIMRFVASLGVTEHILFGTKEIPKRYYPTLEYDVAYFIIDTDTSFIITTLSRNTWKSILEECGIKPEPKLQTTSDTNPIMVKANLANNLTEIFHREGHVMTPFQEEHVSFPLDVNTASASALQTLPGLGPGRAIKICYERDKNGPFLSFEDLSRRVTSIKSKDLIRWKGIVVFSRPSPRLP